jgi:putative spermidine/putrescine transport system permease protein
MTGSRPNLVALAALAPGVLFLAVFFLIPVLMLLQISTWTFEPGTLMRPGFTLDHYAAFLTDPFYLSKIALTARIAAEVTVITLLFSLPLAYWLVRARFAGKGLVLGLVLSPLLTNFVVLIFAWIVLMGDNGAINQTLKAIGMPAAKLLYSEAGVVIALVHISIPYALIPLLAAVSQVGEDVEVAALSLGASPWRAFFLIVVPMCGPGLAAAAFVVVSIVLSGFAFALFVGGDNVLIVPLLIWQQVSKTLNWPLAAAMSMASLFIVVAMLMVGLWIGRVLRPRGTA